MKNYFEEIKKKLIDNINLEDVEIIDNTKFHKSHKSFDPEKYHFFKFSTDILNLSGLVVLPMLFKNIKLILSSLFFLSLLR